MRTPPLFPTFLDTNTPVGEGERLARAAGEGLAFQTSERGEPHELTTTRVSGRFTTVETVAGKAKFISFGGETRCPWVWVYINTRETPVPAGRTTTVFPQQAKFTAGKLLVTEEDLLNKTAWPKWMRTGVDSFGFVGGRPYIPTGYTVAQTVLGPPPAFIPSTVFVFYPFGTLSGSQIAYADGTPIDGSQGDATYARRSEAYVVEYRKGVVRSYGRNVIEPYYGEISSFENVRYTASFGDTTDLPQHDLPFLAARYKNDVVFGFTFRAEYGGGERTADGMAYGLSKNGVLRSLVAPAPGWMWPARITRIGPSTLIAVGWSERAVVLMSTDNGESWLALTAAANLLNDRYHSTTVTLQGSGTSGQPDDVVPDGELGEPFTRVRPYAHTTTTPFDPTPYTKVVPETATTCLFVLPAQEFAFAQVQTYTKFGVTGAGIIEGSSDKLTDYSTQFLPPVPASVWRVNFETNTVSLVSELTWGALPPLCSIKYPASTQSAPDGTVGLDSAGVTINPSEGGHRYVGGASEGHITFVQPNLLHPEDGPYFSVFRSTFISSAEHAPDWPMMFATADDGVIFPGAIKVRAIFGRSKTKYLIYNEGGAAANYQMPRSKSVGSLGGGAFGLQYAGFDYDPRDYQPSVYTEVAFYQLGRLAYAQSNANPHLYKIRRYITEDFKTFELLPDMPRPAYATGKFRWIDDRTISCPMHIGGAYWMCISKDDTRTWRKYRLLARQGLVAPSTEQAAIMPQFRAVEAVTDFRGTPAKMNPYSGAWVCDDRYPAPKFEE